MTTKSSKWSLFFTLREPSVNRKDLQASTLVGPPRDKPEIKPLAELHLYNRLYILVIKVYEIAICLVRWQDVCMFWIRLFLTHWLEVLDNKSFKTLIQKKLRHKKCQISISCLAKRYTKVFFVFFYLWSPVGINLYDPLLWSIFHYTCLHSWQCGYVKLDCIGHHLASTMDLSEIYWTIDPWQCA